MVDAAALTASQYKALLDMQRDLVQVGWHPAVAGQLILRAIGSARRARYDKGGGWGAGFGKIQPTRRVQRDLIPGLAPRPVVAGEQCVRITAPPGREEEAYVQANEYRDRGWNVMEIAPTAGYPSVRAFWACPPGQMPREAQPQILEAEPWGAPYYT